MQKVSVTITAFNGENYHKRLASLSEMQVNQSFACMELTSRDLTPETLRGISVVVDPKDFPEMDRFVVTVTPLN